MVDQNKAAPPPSAAERMSDGEKFMEDLKNDPQSQAVLACILVGIVTLVIFILLSRRRGRGRRDVALLGICDAGKTTMFARLLHDKGVETCTSSAANVGSYRCPDRDGAPPLRVVDVPGHVRIRQRLLDGAKSSLRAVVYVVDSSCVQKQVRDVAEFLFGVLGDAAVGGDAAVDVLIACNKQDLPLAKGCSVIRRELEKEFELLRATHSRSLGGTGGESRSDGRVYLGQEGKDFSFDDISNKVTFAETSSMSEGGLDQVREFLASVA